MWWLEYIRRSRSEMVSGKTLILWLCSKRPIGIDVILIIIVTCTNFEFHTLAHSVSSCLWIIVSKILIRYGILFQIKIPPFLFFSFSRVPGVKFSGSNEAAGQFQFFFLLYLKENVQFFLTKCCLTCCNPQVSISETRLNQFPITVLHQRDLSPNSGGTIIKALQWCCWFETLHARTTQLMCSSWGTAGQNWK